MCEHVEGDRRGELRRSGEVNRSAIMSEAGGSVSHGDDLAAQLVDASESGSGHRLVGARDQSN